LHSPDIHVPPNPTLLSSPEITSSSPKAPWALFTGGLASIPSQTTANTHTFSSVFSFEEINKILVQVFNPDIFSKNKSQQFLGKDDFANRGFQFCETQCLLFVPALFYVYLWTASANSAVGRIVMTSKQITVAVSFCCSFYVFTIYLFVNTLLPPTLFVTNEGTGDLDSGINNSSRISRTPPFSHKMRAFQIRMF